MRAVDSVRCPIYDRYPRSVFVWDEYPEFFRGRLRVLYELTGNVSNVARGALPPGHSGRRGCYREFSGWPRPPIFEEVELPLNMGVATAWPPDAATPS